MSLSTSAQATTIQWAGGAGSNDWNDASNWSSAIVPGATVSDSVIFAGSSNSTALATPFSFANASSITVRDPSCFPMIGKPAGP